MSVTIYIYEVCLHESMPDVSHNLYICLHESMPDISQCSVGFYMPSTYHCLYRTYVLPFIFDVDD